MAPNRLARDRAGSSGPPALSKLQQRAEKQQLQRQSQQPKKEKPIQPLINPLTFKHNAGVVYFLRIYMTVVAGAATGITGITGLQGFLIYLLSQALCTLPIIVMTGGNYQQYFTSWTQVALDHVFSSTAIMSYILMWMIFFNLGHVFT